MHVGNFDKRLEMRNTLPHHPRHLLKKSNVFVHNPTRTKNSLAGEIEGVPGK